MIPKIQIPALTLGLGNPLTLFARLLHGGLLAIGFGTALIVAATWFNHNGDVRAAMLATSQWLSSTEAGLDGNVAALELDDVEVPLGNRLQAAADYVSRRYRVAETGVSQILRTVDSSSREAGLDPLLVIAVIGIESGFNPLSESTMGARGLMQVIGKYHPEKIDLDTNPDALLDPHTNIRVGVRVLQQYLRRTRSVDAALQAYAGAPDDSERSYARKVIAERQRLVAAIRRAETTRTASIGKPSPT